MVDAAVESEVVMNARYGQLQGGFWQCSSMNNLVIVGGHGNQTTLNERALFGSSRSTVILDAYDIMGQRKRSGPCQPWRDLLWAVPSIVYTCRMTQVSLCCPTFKASGLGTQEYWHLILSAARYCYMAQEKLQVHNPC